MRVIRASAGVFAATSRCFADTFIVTTIYVIPLSLVVAAADTPRFTRCLGAFDEQSEKDAKIPITIHNDAATPRRCRSVICCRCCEHADDDDPDDGARAQQKTR